MSSQDRLENVLRDIHVMISKSEAYGTDRIIVSKQDIFSLIDRLNASVYEIMDEYELTKQSRDKALRENKKEGDKIIWDASRQAEDIYAASVMYTDEALNHLHGIVEETNATISRMYKDFQEDMKRQQETIRENQLELKSQLQLLVDTEKYLNLIEERNKEIAKEKAEKQGKKLQPESEKNIYAAIKPEIKINEEYFKRAGIPLDTEEKDQGEAQPAEDFSEEGVIESTLKKVAADVQREMSQETETIQNAQASQQKAQTQQINPGVRPGIKTGIEAARRPQTAAGAEAARRPQTEAGAEAAQRPQTEAGAEAAQRPQPGAGVETVQRPPASQTPADTEIKVNLDSEYFRRKRMESGEEPLKTEAVLEPSLSEPAEKLSILDKLMGKKK